jgi:hypothetical protein
LRWTLAPLGLAIILICNFLIALSEGFFNGLSIYTWLFWGQVLIYLMALTGWFLEERKIKIKILFVPYYFMIMNLAVYLGFRRYIKKQQSVNWERAKRG